MFDDRDITEKFNIDKYQTVESLEEIFQYVSKRLKDESDDYISLITGKYTDANCDMSIMERAMNERNSKIFKLKKITFEILAKFRSIVNHIDYKEDDKK